MDKLTVYFYDIDGFGRPVFKDRHGNYYGVTDPQYLDDMSHEELAEPMRINGIPLEFFGRKFGCEPKGAPVMHCWDIIATPGRFGPKTLRDWKGLRVQLLGDMNTEHVSLPSGSRGTIIDIVSKGIVFRSDMCDCCGASVTVTCKDRSAFSILTPRPEWKDTRVEGRDYRG